MVMKITRIIKSSYAQLCIIFIFAVLLKELGFIQSYSMNFRLLAYVLAAFSIPVLMGVGRSTEKKVPGSVIVLGALFLLALILRLVPYMHTGVPLGYDPGYYKYAIELYQHSLPEIPESTLPVWIKSMYPQGLLVLTDVLHLFTGLGAVTMFKYLFPFLCALLALPVFILTRRLFDERAALIAAALYTVSYTQYNTFVYLYIKSIIGLMFLLLAMYLLERKRYVPLALMYAALGIYHRPEFLLFSLILIPYFAVSRDRNLIPVTLATALLIAPFWLPRLDINLPMLAGICGTALTNIQTDQVASGGGTFFGMGTYEWVALVYLPFGLMGLIYLTLQKRWNTLFFGFLINAAIVLLQLFFFKRFIISLDLLLIILAGAGLNYGFLKSEDVRMSIGAVAVLLLCVSCGVLVVHQAGDAVPLINDKQLDAVVWLSDNAEPDAYLLATSYDAPWVLGWGDRRVIAPGLFQWDIHNRSEWLDFLRTTDPQVAKEFLEQYNNNSNSSNSNIYIYLSKNRMNYMAVEKFDDSAFEELHRSGVLIYKYNSSQSLSPTS